MFGALLNFINKNNLLPAISDTEREALEAGTVWVDGELFSGNPNWEKIANEAYHQMSPEEQAYYDGPVEELCRMCNDYEISTTREVPQEIWDFMNNNGFFGFNIPAEFGGNKMSAVAKSTIMIKVTSANLYVGTCVVIPNSLGPGELLTEYGTPEQKAYYLPKLANGEMFPCFGLTEPTAGSDAASIKAEAVVYKGEDGEPMLRMNFRKRYITCAPVANMMSIACQLHDPENLLGKGEFPGITCVLIEKGQKGLYIGDHHDPMTVTFPNGPIVGRDIEVPAGNIIGGIEWAGRGWYQLMQTLAGGRAVSLPATGLGMAKGAAAATGMWSMTREQFNMAIGKMDGVEEFIAKIAGVTYALDAGRVFSCSALDAGERPPVISALMKAYSTEEGRELLKHGMDIFAGSGVMAGPNNIMQRGYIGAPIGITVEGANIMTRTLIVYGQGVVRCHPYSFKMVETVQANDVKGFRRALIGWMGHMVKTDLRVFFRYFTRGLTGGAPKNVDPATKKYYRKLGWASSRFAFLTEIALFLVGANLKRRGKLTGVYSDALAWMYFAMSSLRRFEAEGRQEEDRPAMNYAVQYSLNQVQEAFGKIYDNINVMNWWFRGIGKLLFKLNPMIAPMRFEDDAAVAASIQSRTGTYERLVNGMFVPDEDAPGTGRLMKAILAIEEAAPAAEKVKAAVKAKKIEKNPATANQQALDAGVITQAEFDLLADANTKRLAAYEVDVFSPEAYKNRGMPYDTPLGGAKEALFGDEAELKVAS
jgi:acyl-CoA dehydrogenase